MLHTLLENGKKMSLPVDHRIDESGFSATDMFMDSIISLQGYFGFMFGLNEWQTEEYANKMA